MILKPASCFFLEPCVWSEWQEWGDGAGGAGVGGAGVGGGWSSCSDSCACGEGLYNFAFGAYLNRSRSCECPTDNSLQCPTEDDRLDYRYDYKSQPTEAYQYELCVNSDCPRK